MKICHSVTRWAGRATSSSVLNYTTITPQNSSQYWAFILILLVGPKDGENSPQNGLLGS